MKRQKQKNIHIKANQGNIQTTGSNGNNNQTSNNNKLTEEIKLSKGSIYEEGENADDCKMIIVQNWTPCSVACGGGNSLLQLKKIPAKNEGKDCKTKETVLKKECNTHPCPTVESIGKELKTLKEIRKNNNNKPIPVKTVRMSDRPERYEKCNLKETDAFMEKNDEIKKNNSKKSPKGMEIPLIPIRLVMNDKTLTAYEDEDSREKKTTYLLEESRFIKTDDIRKCFIIKNNISQSKFCMLSAAKGDFLEEWFYDFNLFKYQCRKEREKSDKFIVEEKKLEKEYQEKINSVKMELVQSKAEAVKISFEEEERKKLEKKINQFRKMSFSAMEKELKLEDLLEKEEEFKQQSESETLEQQIAQEKKKEETLIKAIREKELESQLNVAKSQAEKAISEIRKNTQSQILQQRQKIAKRLLEIRQKNKRKNAQLKNQILSIRSNIAERLKTINRKGDLTTCMDSKNMDNYCKKYFIDNFVKMNECNTKSSFCYVCCENEFGELHVVERDECYSRCDKN